MNCESVQNWLMRADGLDPTHWSPDVADHMQTCSACNSLAYDLLKLEEDWRRRPIPAECESAKSAFLKTLPVHCFNAKPAPRRRFAPMRWAAAAAVLLICTAGVTWLALAPGEIHASSDLVERLIDWNVDISVADSRDRRQLAEREEDFRKDLEKARLSNEDRRLAEELLEDALSLANSNDPLSDADRLRGMADKLIVKVDTATKKGNERDSQRFTNCYSKLMERGYNQMMTKLSQSKSFEGEKKSGFDQFMNRDQQHHKQLEKVMKQLPNGFRPDVRNKLEAVRKGLRNLPHFGHKK